MKTGKILLLGAVGLFLLGAFKKKTPLIPEEKEIIPDDEQQQDDTPVASKVEWVTNSPYTNQAGHPLSGLVPLFVERYYDENHINSPFTSVNIQQNGLPPFVSAFTNIRDGIPVNIYEESEYQPGRVICRITDFQEQPIPDEEIIKFLENPDKYTALYFQNNGIAVPLSEVPRRMPFNRNIWILKEHLKQVPLTVYRPGAPGNEFVNGINKKRSI